MTSTSHSGPNPAQDRILAGLTPAETARYTRDLLESLREIALRQNHLVLAGLLEAAAREAKKLAGASL